MIFEPTVTIFSSILSIREVIAGNATVMRQCRAVVNYQEQSERELVTSIFVTSANTSKNVIIKGEVFLTIIMLFIGMKLNFLPRGLSNQQNRKCLTKNLTL